MNVPRSPQPTKITVRAHQEYFGSSYICQKHLSDPQENIQWTGTKAELSGRFLSCYTWREINSAVLMESYILLSIRKFWKENIEPSVHALMLKQTWVMQQVNDLKHISKYIPEF